MNSSVLKVYAACTLQLLLIRYDLTWVRVGMGTTLPGYECDLVKYYST